ncbi:hypothetical protein [Rhizobium sp. AAP43]|uniref:hypothetical protein n=2 Tax=unclassified Rhizobium TaxID=2613769 RepID=UPI0012E0E9CC|nr:hypothetical protein [Rhizobium sp. AAP43]
MALPFHPVRSLRRAMSQIEHAISASAGLSQAARHRQVALERGETPTSRPIEFQDI